MNLAIAFEVVLAAALMALLLTQLAFPLLRGTRLFPWFRRRDAETRLRHELEEAKQRLAEAQLTLEIEQARRQAVFLEQQAEGGQKDVGAAGHEEEQA